jgi:hypothetical protein
LQQQGRRGSCGWGRGEVGHQGDGWDGGGHGIWVTWWWEGGDGGGAAMVGQAWTPSGGGDPGGGAAAGALKVLGAMDLEKGSCRGAAVPWEGEE